LWIDTPESDENNEKTQQQEATPAQLKSDKETTALKQKTTKGDKKDIWVFSLFSSDSGVSISLGAMPGLSLVTISGLPSIKKQQP
jgi:hypothetical protein